MTLLGQLVPRVSDLPWVALASVPTPITHLSKIGPNVYAKRDDLISEVYGGNKVRRFEFLLGQAIAQGKSSVITLGGTASTQVTALAKFAKELGISSSAVLFSQPIQPYMREALASDIEAGMSLSRGGSIPLAGIKFLLALARQKNAFVVMPGASGALPNLGYVDAALELGRQVDAGILPKPDRIVLPVGSGGTLAGLVVGLGMLGWSTVVTGVRIAERFVVNRTMLNHRVRDTRRFLRSLGHGFRKSDRTATFTIDPRFLGAGYGAPTPAALRGARRVEELFGAPGEVTYSGKAMAALERIARDNPHETILFWCTLSSTGRRPAADTPLPNWAQEMLSRVGNDGAAD